MNLKIIKKTSVAFLILQILMVTNVLADSMTQSVTVESDDVKLSVEYQKNYSNSGEVSIKTVIENHSDNIIGIVLASRIHGVRIILIGPDGSRVKTLPYSLDTKRNTFGKIHQNEKSEDDIYLAGCFPFENVGEYRCTITRRVYDISMLDISKVSLQNRGNPIDLIAPEFTFRVDAVKPIDRARAESNAAMLQGYVLDGIGGVTHEEQTNPHDAPLNQAGDSSNAVSSHHSSAGGGPTNSKESKIVSLRNWWWALLLLPVLFLVCLVIRRINPK